MDAASIGLLGLAVGAYAATNVDDFLLLLGFFGEPATPARDVVGAQFAAMVILMGASAVAALLALHALPPAIVGVLGIVPVALGLAKLWEGRAEPGAAPVARTRPWTMASAFIASGGDNIATYASIIAGQSRQATALMGGVFLLLTGLWCWGAWRLARDGRVGAAVQRLGGRGLPYVLIGLGVVLLARTALASP